MADAAPPAAPDAMRDALLRVLDDEAAAVRAALVQAAHDAAVVAGTLEAAERVGGHLETGGTLRPAAAHPQQASAPGEAQTPPAIAARALHGAPSCDVRRDNGVGDDADAHPSASLSVEAPP